jgi:hypothetical protein
MAQVWQGSFKDIWPIIVVRLRPAKSGEDRFQSWLRISCGHFFEL